MKLGTLTQLAHGYRELGRPAQEALEALRFRAPIGTQDRAALEHLERWLQVAALDGVDGAGQMALEIREHLYPNGRAFSGPFALSAGRPGAA